MAATLLEINSFLKAFTLEEHLYIFGVIMICYTFSHLLLKFTDLCRICSLYFSYVYIQEMDDGKSTSPKK